MMANKRGQEIDKTHLSIDLAEERGIIHRDYLAHCHRWSHVVKHLHKSRAYSSAIILDVGCGKELPMAKLLYSNRLIPERYIGVDVNKLDIDHFNFGKMKELMFLYGQTDICDLETSIFSFPPPNIITCFEVLEHVEPDHARRILLKIHDIMDEDGVAFISTPNWNGKDTAGNHVNEMRFEALARLIMDCGFGIQKVYGTFASQREIEPVLFKEHPTVIEVYEELKRYYDSNVLSVIFAPLYPKDSRNCLWQLTKGEVSFQPIVVPDWQEIQEPWTSSDRWRELKDDEN